jgi:hypothetical protein
MPYPTNILLLRRIRTRTLLQCRIVNEPLPPIQEAKL